MIFYETQRRKNNMILFEVLDEVLFDEVLDDIQVLIFLDLMIFFQIFHKIKLDIEQIHNHLDLISI
jgi:hypothetical protein